MQVMRYMFPIIEYVHKDILTDLGWHWYFMDKSAISVDIVYIKYFTDLERIHEYNWNESCLAYLYSKSVEGSLWKTKHMKWSNHLFQVIYLHPYW